MNPTTLLLLAIFCIFTVVSVVLMRHVFNAEGFQANAPFIFRLIINPLFILSLLSGACCRVIFYAMFQNLTMNETFLITLISTVFVLGAGVWFFGDVLDGKQMLGAGLIVLGVGLVGL